MKATLPVGITDFRTVRTPHADGGRYLFVDKSDFIREVLESCSHVTLYSRPRYFGKTMNLSMLYYFLSCTASNTADLFRGLKIEQEAALCTKYQGQWPVIFLSFADIQSIDYDGAYSQLADVMAHCYRQFSYLLENEKVMKYSRDEFVRVMHGKAEEVELAFSLLRLTNMLNEHHGKNPFVLVDAYDTPIHRGVLHGYSEKIGGVIISLLGAALKDNKYLRQGVLTGLVHVLDSSMDCVLNNWTVNTLLDSRHTDCFGFTEQEVAELVAHSPSQVDLKELNHWYGGYSTGDATVTLYNPGSLLSCLAQGGKFGVYWKQDLLGNALIRRLMTDADAWKRKYFIELMQRGWKTRQPDAHVGLSDLPREHWGDTFALLYALGYLTATFEDGPGVIACRATYNTYIPNQEIYAIYEETVLMALSESGVEDEIRWVEGALRVEER